MILISLLSSNESVKRQFSILLLGSLLIAVIAYFFPFESISSRDVNRVNRGNLVMIAKLINDYQAHNSGRLPPSLDKLRFEGDASFLLCRPSFESKGFPWIYDPNANDEIIVRSPVTVKGLSFGLSLKGEIIEQQ